MLSGQHHIAIIAGDYEKARAFYVDKLGFRLVREVYREAQGDYLRMLKVCTDITGDTEAYRIYGTDVEQKISSLLKAVEAREGEKREKPRLGSEAP